MIALFFDTETTGIKNWKNPEFVPRLVQLGAILQNLESGRILGEVNLLVHPMGVEIPEGAAKVHGITTDVATSFGLPMDVIDLVFHGLIEKAEVVIAHNAAYDLDIVKDNLVLSAGILSTKSIFCTMEASRYVVQAPLTHKQLAYFASKPEKQDHPFKSPNLSETYRHFFGSEFEGAHDAMADIRACRDIFGQLRHQGYYELAGGRVLETDKMMILRAQS